MTAAPFSRPAVGRAVGATYVAFIGSGLGFGSWAARIPQVVDQLDLSPRDLGLVLLAIAAGSVLALPLAGWVIARIGTRRLVTAMAVLLAVALAGAGVSSVIGVLPLVVSLFLLGTANGAWDVGMNVQGAVVEQHLGRTIMSRFHAGFSVGTVAGALITSLMVWLGVGVAAHLVGIALLVGVAVPLGVRAFLPEGDVGPSSEDGDAGRPAPSVFDAWREPRTLLIGLFVLAFAFAEGSANDWIAVAVLEGYGAPDVVGPLTFAVFLTAMTVGRWFGPGLLDRFGRVPVIRTMASVALVGLGLFILAPSVELAVVGAFLWGGGISLGFPLGMSAAADDPERAPARVSVVASIGYVAFLGGPPLLGLLGEDAGVLRALSVVAVLLALALLVSGAVRPLQPAQERRATTA
ncbi:MFS transporter [uncultured Pseudokineococcus sp.]|uniref:MFS transporter n=1 Tax=uncultured Pseudokineococcus sp. TaxID=1642928 RepID=UPI00260E576D|nr:MFS transporter [uncultured Pseudokineococcus sp.]